jgi:hypothetical protein
MGAVPQLRCLGPAGVRDPSAHFVATFAPCERRSVLVPKVRLVVEQRRDPLERFGPRCCGVVCRLFPGCFRLVSRPFARVGFGIRGRSGRDSPYPERGVSIRGMSRRETEPDPPASGGGIGASYPPFTPALDSGVRQVHARFGSSVGNVANTVRVEPIEVVEVNAKAGIGWGD